MNDVLLSLVVTSGVLALVAWICVHITRPFFASKTSRIISQTAASFLLLISFGLSKAMQSPGSGSTDELVSVFLIFLAIKAVAMYLIGCYAKSVGKSPYWSFIGLLNFGLALIIMASSLWRDPKPKHQQPVGE